MPATIVPAAFGSPDDPARTPTRVEPGRAQTAHEDPRQDERRDEDRDRQHRRQPRGTAADHVRDQEREVAGDVRREEPEPDQARDVEASRDGPQQRGWQTRVHGRSAEDRAHGH